MPALAQDLDYAGGDWDATRIVPASGNPECGTAQPTSLTAVIGDRRPYVTALLVLDEDATTAWARLHGLPESLVPGELTADPRLRKELSAAVEHANSVLSRPEQVKAFHVVDGAWAPETGELTPKLSLRRSVIEERYAAEIDRLYAGTAQPTEVTG
jgi:long-chain acyl-CoA synthetase